ncbi:EexN family lipoprotein [Aureimonas altamirensis]|uniref:EexN family lipoprotein n=1 Tax=Aureimonas altamirensis TaxID=370622 RepID=UPI00203683A9|nr:EexN family lipoprotein [Aureimonas altamirensis]MCM2505658.1 EexN family lipoprotein [Aureimonas altamirensis]
MMLVRLLLFVTAALVLVGCGSEPEQTAEQPSSIPTAEIGEAGTSEDETVVRDVQFFIDNPDERRAVREQCRNDPGALENSRDCVNADEANSQARRQSTRERLGG